MQTSDYGARNLMVPLVKWYVMKYGGPTMKIEINRGARVYIENTVFKVVSVFAVSHYTPVKHIKH